MTQRKLAIALAATLALVACGGSDEPPAGSTVARSDPGVVHIHGLGRDPADGALMIATHTGLFRLAAESAPVRIAGRYQDTMGFTVVGPGHFLGSGHPGSVRDGPPFLGLIESRDAGESWNPVSLSGKADFHVLEAAGRTVYGYGSDFETRGPRFLRSSDGGRTWSRLSAPEPLVSLAIDPGSARRLVAAGERSAHFSADSGLSWRPLPVPGGWVVWTPRHGLVAADPDGVLRTAREPSGRWRETGRLAEPPAALEAAGDELLAATHGGGVLSSRDGGKTWRAVLAE